MSDIITVIMIAAFIALMFFFKSKEKKYEQTQDLVRYQNIYSDGLIEMPEQVYRVMLEAIPINVGTKSPKEQLVIWDVFREMQNVLNVNASYIVQSRHMDIDKYLSSLEELSRNVVWEGMDQVAQNQRDFFRTLTKDNHVKEHRYYILLEFDPYVAQLNIQVESEALQRLLSMFSKQKISAKDALSVAKHALDEAANIASKYCMQMGVKVKRLDRIAIIENMYTTLNRDLAAIQKFETYFTDRVFSRTTESLQKIYNERDDTVAENAEEKAYAKEA